MAGGGSVSAGGSVSGGGCVSAGWVAPPPCEPPPCESSSFGGFGYFGSDFVPTWTSFGSAR